MSEKKIENCGHFNALKAAVETGVVDDSTLPAIVDAMTKCQEACRCEFTDLSGFNGKLNDCVSAALPHPQE